MSSDRKKPGAAFWATVVLVVALVGYPLSFGPACWITSHLNSGAGSISFVYRPILWAAWRDVDADYPVIHRYAELVAARDWHWSFDPDRGGAVWGCFPPP